MCMPGVGGRSGEGKHWPEAAAAACDLIVFEWVFAAAARPNVGAPMAKGVVYSCS